MAAVTFTFLSVPSSCDLCKAERTKTRPSSELSSRRSSRQPLPEHLPREVYVQMPEADHAVAGRSKNCTSSLYVRRYTSISERRFAAISRQLINRCQVSLQHEHGLGSESLLRTSLYTRTTSTVVQLKR